MSEKDFDRGFGIGGLQRRPEPLAAGLSVTEIQRMMDEHENATRCSCCGQSEADGAMFTTAPWSGKCDDCFD